MNKDTIKNSIKIFENAISEAPKAKVLDWHKPLLAVVKSYQKYAKDAIAEGDKDMAQAYIQDAKDIRELCDLDDITAIQDEIAHLDTDVRDTVIDALQEAGFDLESDEEDDDEMSAEEIAKWQEKQKVLKNALKSLATASEQDQLKAISKNHWDIQHMPNASPKVRMAALKSNGNAIEYINNPTEQEKLAAVIYGTADTISKIKDPSEAMKLAAVDSKGNHGYALRYIENPSDPVIMTAMKKDIINFRDVKNPSPQVIELAKKLNYEKRRREY